MYLQNSHFLLLPVYTNACLNFRPWTWKAVTRGFFFHVSLLLFRVVKIFFCFPTLSKIQMADNTVIKPTATTPAIDTSNWPLLLKVKKHTQLNRMSL